MNHLLLLLLSSLLMGACASETSSSLAENKADSVLATSLQTALPLTTPTDSIAVTYLLGQFEPAQDTHFVKLADVHTAGSGRGAYLHKETYEAFVQMFEAAQADGVTLSIRSATRNFDRQKQIWEGKWEGRILQGGENLAQTTPDPVARARKILHTSSMPGTSRHHWGTDMDLNAFENSYFKSGQGKIEYDWLLTHAADYGFGQPYTEKGEQRPEGYEEERWHWSYLPLSRIYLAAYQTSVRLDMIKGFKGAETATPLNVIEHYVSGINPDCR